MKAHAEGPDIKRGDWIHTPDGSFQVTRVDDVNEELILTNGVGTFIMSELAFPYGDAMHETKEQYAKRSGKS